MRTLGFWILSAAAVFLALTCSLSTSETSFALGKLDRSVPVGGVKAELSNKKLKDSISESSTATTMCDLNSYTLEDYQVPDPSPSSKVDVHSRPIEHGTPLNPFVPGPSPPNPRQGSSP